MTILPAIAAGGKRDIRHDPSAEKGDDRSPGHTRCGPTSRDVTGFTRLEAPGGIAALAYGTDTVQKVDKIVGPGKQICDRG